MNNYFPFWKNNRRMKDKYIDQDLLSCVLGQDIVFKTMVSL